MKKSYNIIGYIVSAIVHMIVYSVVGILYGLKLIGGRKAGKIAYAVLSIIATAAVTMWLAKLGISLK